MSVPPQTADAAAASANVPVQTAEAPPASVAPQSTQRLVFRNTLFLLVAQVVGMPLSIVVNAVMARHLGPEEFGYIYLAGTLAAFGFLVVDWGQIGTLPALVAKDRPRAGEYLGSGLAWRVSTSVVIYGVLTGIATVIGYDHKFQIALGLIVLQQTIAAVTSAFQDTIRGFERTNIGAVALVGQQLLTALFVVPTLLLGGRLYDALGAQAVAYACVCVFIILALRSMRIGALSFRPATVRMLIHEGSPFLVLGLVNALQPNVDALMLSKLSTPQAVGWLAAARKLVGVLIFPAASLIGAIYPTLCRLYAEDVEAFKKSVNGALRTSTVLVVPIALGCALYADLGVRIFSREAFGPAEDDLRVLAAFIFLLYFSMILGTALAAAEIKKQWAVVQFGCVVLSACLDPLLIPFFQRRSGNGGLGVCVSTVASEVVVLIAGLVLLPRGIVDRKLLRSVALAGAAGAAMAGVARLLSGVTPFVAAPIAVAVYAGVLWGVGGIDEEQLVEIRAIVARKAGRRANAG